jgi:radical SAM/Cys-rich protein
MKAAEKEFMNSFDQVLRRHLCGTLRAEQPQTIQLNLGLRCNLSCRHCHVEGGPHRTEIMSWETMQAVLRLARSFPAARIDLTGGAPELNPHFRRFVQTAREQGHPVQVRTNLTVLFEAGMEDIPEFYRRHQVQLVASLPCYLDRNVDAQRGSGVFTKSMQALRRLNQLGYGRDEALQLNLVYNPGGPSLPPDQAGLETDYRQQLRETSGVTFSRLLTITNMPIGRFLEDLRRQDQEDLYWQLLEESFNPHTVDGLMCRHQICVAWDGSLSDCDFNQVLGLGLADGLPRRIDQIDPQQLSGRQIVTDRHCFGCTAGCGSSCGGALVA